MRASGRRKIIEIVIEYCFSAIYKNVQKLMPKNMSNVVILQSFSILVASLVDLFLVFDDFG